VVSDTASKMFFAEALFRQGWTDLVSVIPPGAQLAPSSKIQGSQVGKVPGRRLASGLWVGYNWRKVAATLEDAKQWSIDGANIGVRADNFPSVDIDCTDPKLAQIIEDFFLGKLGAAPIRTGRAPKRLLMYRTDAPFGRMRLWIERKDQHHLVEILGMGQQYVVHGIHPATGKPYTWDSVLSDSSALTPITRESAEEALSELAELLDMLGGWKLEREGDGKPITRSEHVDQPGLVAPSLEILRDAVSYIPNTSDLFPDRTSYLKIGYAIRAASGSSDDEGFDVFAEWAAKWEGNDRAPNGNDPETVRADWRRFRPPFSVGWSYIAERARAFGYNDAANDFEPVGDAPEDVGVPNPVQFSDQWLAERVVQRRRGELRYVPAQDKFLVWDSGRWQPDAVKLAEDVIKTELKIIANDVARHGDTDKAKKEFGALAVQICSAGKAGAVRTLLQSARQIATSADVLDHDAWILNTPSGMIDLKTGKVLAADPDQLCTKSTAVPADFNGSAPEWRRFLAETTGGDRELERYLQKLAGYMLTGSTREQTLTFIWGPGGNGKSVFVTTLSSILADYARTATMDTFTASTSDRHSTDIAMLHGARMVSASETQAGKRWDEARVKSLTGGEPVTARFMRQDNFTFLPQFKLVFIGNHKPEIRDIDAAFRRRIHLVPFTITPKNIDRELASKLRKEYPAILAWMVEGCLLWQQEGLTPPAIVRETTEEYFREEDAVQRWLDENTEADKDSNALTSDLYQNWREWANRNGEFPGTMRRFSSALISKRLARWRDPRTRRNGFGAIKLKPQSDLGGVI
jgi:P4 family phage/plasmid primase-like protien